MNTLDTIEAVRTNIEMLQAELEHMHSALREAHRVHQAVESVNHLSWDDAEEELADDPDVGSYEQANYLLEQNREKPELLGVCVKHLTPAAINRVHDILGQFRASEQHKVIRLVSESKDPEATAKVIEDTMAFDGYEYAVVPAAASVNGGAA